MNKKKIEDLKKKLSTEQYNVCFLKGTEPPFSGKFTYHKQKGMYVCIVCSQPLFSSKAKFESTSGWPSFDVPAKKENIQLKSDDS